MERMVKNTLKISGNDFSWMEENNNAIEHLDSFNANIEIALRLKHCMKERGWNQKRLARALGVSPQYVNKLLRNQEPSFSVNVAFDYGRKLNYPLIKICDDLDTEYKYKLNEVIKHEEVLEPFEICEINTSIFNGFKYLREIIVGKKRCRNKELLISSNIDLKLA